jgi:hypothetical protein
LFYFDIPQLEVSSDPLLEGIAHFSRELAHKDLSVGQHCVLSLQQVLANIFKANWSGAVPGFIQRFFCAKAVNGSVMTLHGNQILLALLFAFGTLFQSLEVMTGAN